MTESKTSPDRKARSTNSKNPKPSGVSATWSTGKAAVYRSDTNSNEKTLRQKFHELGVDDETFTNLLANPQIDEVAKLMKKLKLLQTKINKGISQGYIYEAPEKTPVQIRETARKENVDEALVIRLKQHIGHGRKAQKFKYDFENKSMFTRQLINLYPVDFLSVPLVRNSLLSLYDSIDISDFELKQKDIDAKKPKEQNERQYNAEMKQIEDCKPKPKPEPEPEPVLRSPSSKKECVADLMNCGSESESEFEDNHEKLSLNTILRRKKRAHKNYMNAKIKLAEMSIECDPNEHFQLQNEKKQCRGHFKKYARLEKDYGSNATNEMFYDSEEDAIGASQYTDLTGETIDLNDLAKEGVSNMSVTGKGKKRKKYKDPQILQISTEITQYFNSPAQDPEYFKDIDTLDKKERYTKFSSLVKKFKSGRGSIAGFKLLIDASSNNPELVCKLLEDEFQSRHSIDKLI
jgi:hypothetical protein